MAKYAALREHELLPIGFPHNGTLQPCCKNRAPGLCERLHAPICSVRRLNIIQKTHQNKVLRKINHEYEVN